MVVFLGGMIVDIVDSAFELSTNALSSDTECELSSWLANNIDKTNMASMSMDTSSGGPYEVYEQSWHCGDDHDDISLCAGFGREHWVGFDVVLLNELGVPVADEICGNSNPPEFVDTTPLMLTMSACSLEKIV